MQTYGNESSWEGNQAWNYQNQAGMNTGAGESFGIGDGTTQGQFIRPSLAGAVSIPNKPMRPDAGQPMNPGAGLIRPSQAWDNVGYTHSDNQMYNEVQGPGMLSMASISAQYNRESSELKSSWEKLDAALSFSDSGLRSQTNLGVQNYHSNVTETDRGSTLMERARFLSANPPPPPPEEDYVQIQGESTGAYGQIVSARQQGTTNVLFGGPQQTGPSGARQTRPSGPQQTRQGVLPQTRSDGMQQSKFGGPLPVRPDGLPNSLQFDAAPEFQSDGMLYGSSQGGRAGGGPPQSLRPGQAANRFVNPGNPQVMRPGSSPSMRFNTPHSLHPGASQSQCSGTQQLARPEVPQLFDSYEYDEKSAYGNESETYANEKEMYENESTMYGHDQGKFGTDQAEYGNEQREYGNEQGEDGNEEREYGNEQGVYGNEDHIEQEFGMRQFPGVPPSGPRGRGSCFPYPNARGFCNENMHGNEQAYGPRMGRGGNQVHSMLEMEPIMQRTPGVLGMRARLPGPSSFVARRGGGGRGGFADVTPEHQRSTINPLNTPRVAAPMSALEAKLKGIAETTSVELAMIQPTPAVNRTPG